MPIVLLRIDERLLHGQVIVGWGMRLRIDYYVVVDDPLASSEWEQDLYEAGLPEDARAIFLSVPAAVERFAELEGRPERGAVLTRGTTAMRALAEAGVLRGRRINIGGLHAAPGRRKALDYLYLRPGEMDDLLRIRNEGASVTARDLPDAADVDLSRVANALGGGEDRDQMRQR